MHYLTLHRKHLLTSDLEPSKGPNSIKECEIIESKQQDVVIERMTRGQTVWSPCSRQNNELSKYQVRMFLKFKTRMDTSGK